MAAPATTKDGPPPLLTKLYGAGKAVTLRDLLLRLSSLSQEAAHLKETLVQPLDHPDYAVHLLSNTFCVVNPSARSLEDGFSLEQHFSQTELINRAIEAVLREVQGKNNVLTLGCRKRRPSVSGQQLVGSSTAESYYHNSVSASLEAPAWQLLLSRIGDTLMLFLLLHVSMFSRLRNNCCLQLTGAPVVQVARSRWYMGSRGVAEAAPAVQAEVQPPAAHTQDGKLSTAGAASNGLAHPGGSVDGSSRRGTIRRAAEAEGGGGGEAEDGTELQQPRRKRHRPSSWQRRKAAAAAAQQAAAQAETSAMYIDDEVLVPPTQPVSEAGPAAHALASAAAPAQPQSARVAAKSSAFGFTQWPRQLPKPTDMMLPRQPIFYCSSFPRKPGFTAKHILKVLRGRQDAGRVLFSAIFKPANNPVGRESRSYAPHHSAVFQPAKRVPVKNRHLVPLLQRLSERAAKCPFGILLNAYCPLPPHLRKSAAAAGTAAGGAEAAAGGVHGDSQHQQQQQQQQQHQDADLDAMMDELYRLEQQQEQRGSGALSAAAQQAGTGTAAGSGASGRGRNKQSGLTQLIAEAGSNLQPAFLVGSMSQGGHDSVLGSGGIDQTAAALVAPHFGDQERATSDSFPGEVPATQPLQGEDAIAASSQPAAEQPGAATVPGGLGHQCPAPPQLPSPPNPTAEALAACFVPHAQVCGFVWAVLRRIVPPQLLGAKRAQRALRAAVRRFISLRRYEQMTAHQVVQGLPTSALRWLATPFISDQQPGQPGHATNGASASGAGHVPPTQFAAQQRRLCLWVGWLFCVVVVPLLRAHFYCTESEAYRQQVFYYRKPLWAQLAANEVAKLKEGQFTPVAAAEALALLQRRKLGVARLRLLPKRVGMRFLINLGCRSSVTFRVPSSRAGQRTARTSCTRPAQTTLQFKRSVNDLLASVLPVLKFEAAQHPDVLGASVYGYDDTYCRLQPFIRRWRAATATGAAATASGAVSDSAAGATSTSLSPPLSPLPHLVSFDATRAFDHVDVPTLLSLVEPLLRSDSYLVLKYSEVVPFLGAFKVVPRRVAVAGSPGQIDFPARAAQLAMGHKNRVYLDEVVYERVARVQALELLRQHLQANLVRLQRSWHRQARGIAQGGRLSTILCCMYLAHVEKAFIMPIMGSIRPLASIGNSAAASSRQHSWRGDGAATGGSLHTTSKGRLTSLAGGADSLASQHSLLSAHPHPHHQQQQLSVTRPGTFSQSALVRTVDDWLLITPSAAEAEAAARTVVGGFPQYNIFVNPDKTKLSFPLALADGRTLPPGTWDDGNGRRFIKWCGLLFNADNLEVQGDYTRYVGEHVKTALTLPLRRRPGAALAQKLCHYVRTKMHPLLLDPVINCPLTARLNIYQAFLLAAMKFHCFVAAMPAPPAHGSGAFLAAIEACISYVRMLVRPRQVAPVRQSYNSVKYAGRFPPVHVRYLGLYAFRHTLRRKHAVYGELLAALDEALGSPDCMRCAALMAPAVDPACSQVFQAILY